MLPFFSAKLLSSKQEFVEAGVERPEHKGQTYVRIAESVLLVGPGAHNCSGRLSGHLPLDGWIRRSKEMPAPFCALEQTSRCCWEGLKMGPRLLMVRAARNLRPGWRRSVVTLVGSSRMMMGRATWMGKSGDATSPLLVLCRLHGLTLLAGFVCRLSRVRLQREDVGNFPVAIFPRSNGAFISASKDRERRRKQMIYHASEQATNSFKSNSGSDQPNTIPIGFTTSLLQLRGMDECTHRRLSRNQKDRRCSAWTTNPSRLSYAADSLVHNSHIKKDNERKILGEGGQSTCSLFKFPALQVSPQASSKQAL